jgi:Fe-S cluster biosynthesis and repair protein YggX
MAERMVKCVKLGRELPGLEEPPWGGELGQRIYENVSQEAWNQWLDYLRMLINEYRLAPATKEAQEFIAQQMERFFFGEGSALPPGYVPTQR